MIVQNVGQRIISFHDWLRYTMPRVAAALAYLLNAPFTADDQGYANGQVLDTAGEGVTDGSLTVVEVDGTLAVVSNKCAFTAQSTPAWTDLGFYSQAIARTLGYGLLATINLSTWEEMGIGWHTSGAVVDPDNFAHALQANGTDGRLDVEGGTAIATGLSSSSDIQLCVVLGGYNAAGVPYYSGQAAADYTYGAAYYGKGTGLGSGSQWVLLWRKSTGGP